MESITYNYGPMDEPATVVPLWDIPELNVLEDMDDESLIQVNGVKTTMCNIRDYFAFERLGFCGCGLPDEVDRFWADQIASIENDKPIVDYFGYAGGLEYFIQTAIKQGILNKERKLTPLGRLALLVIATHYTLDVGEEYQEPTRVPDYVHTRADEFDNEQDKIDYFLLRALVVPGIRRQVELPNATWDEQRDLRFNSNPMSLVDGGFYWLYHSIEELDLAEHGSSAPGWLTLDGYAKLIELTQRFGAEELAIDDLVTGGYIFRITHSDEMRPLMPLFKERWPDLDLDYFFRTPKKVAVFDPGFNSVGCTMTYEISNTFPAGKKA